MTIQIWRLIGLASKTLLGHYLLIWTLVLGPVIAWVMSCRLPPNGDRPTARPSPPVDATRGGAGVLLAFGLFLAGYILLIFYQAGFADYDDSIVALPILGAAADVTSVWPHLGRFFPFGNQEWTLLRRVTTSPLAYHGFAVAELLLLVAIVPRVLREWTVTGRVLLLALLLVTPSFLYVFAGLVYPERNLLLLLALLILCLQAWSDQPTRWRLLATLAVIHVALYLKEPVFLLVGGVAALRLLLAWYAMPRADRSIVQVVAAHPLETGMLALAAIYAGMYLGIMLPRRSTAYLEVDGQPLGPIGTVGVHLRSDPMLLVFLAAVAVRAYGLVRHRRPPDPFWDPLALGALLYAGTFFWLGMRRPYYMAPVDFIGLLYAGHLTRAALGDGRSRRATVAVGTAGLAVLLFAQSWFVMVEKKNVVIGKTRMAEYIAEFVRNAPQRPVPLFLPHPRRFLVMEFAAYLDLRGIRVERVSGAGSPVLADVTLTSPAEFRDHRCASWVVYRCEQAGGPPPGGLAVVLPDDEAPKAGEESLRPPVEPAFTYRPWIEPAALVPFLRGLRRMMDPDWRRLYRRTDWLWGYIWQG